jgi:hypothetical protein
MSSLFSSPSKTAEAAASGEQGVANNDTATAEKYVATTEGQERNAIASQGQNPYYAAAGTMSPSNYAVNPKDTVAFAAPTPPGMTSNVGGVPPSSSGNPFAPQQPIQASVNAPAPGTTGPVVVPRSTTPTTAVRSATA